MATAEFWMAIAFLLILFISFIPLKKLLSAWGQKRAQKIQQELDEAHHLAQTAQELLKQSEMRLRNKDRDIRQIIDAEMHASNDLLYQTQLDCAKEYAQKQQEVAHRLNLIQKQATEEFNQKIMDITLSLAAEQIKQKTKAAGKKQKLMQQDVDLFLASLDRHKDTLQGILK